MNTLRETNSILPNKRVIYSPQYISAINLFWFGFSLYTIGFTIAATGTLSIKALQAFQFAGLALLLFSAGKLITFRISNIYLRIIYVFYCTWLFIVVLKGFSLNYDFIKQSLANPYGGVLIYCVPLVLLIPRTPFFLKQIFKTIIILGGTFLGCAILFHSKILNADIGSDNSEPQIFIIEFFAKTLSISSGFLLLTYTYHSKAKRLFSLLVIVLTILVSIVTARRGLTFSFGMVLISYGILILYMSKRKFWTILTFVFALALIFRFIRNETSDNNFGLFGSLKERLDQDTRSEVEMYFFADMQTKDWTIGRGMSGLIAAPYHGVNSDHVEGKPGYRNGIETDYLNIILKGGLISIGLLLLILIPATIKGMFFSKNLLSKAAGMWILLWMVDLYPTTVTAFNLRYLLVWICVGICYSKKIRNVSEGTMRKYFLTVS